MFFVVVVVMVKSKRVWFGGAGAKFACSARRVKSTRRASRP